MRGSASTWKRVGEQVSSVATAGTRLNRGLGHTPLQEKFAEKLGLDGVHVTRVENGVVDGQRAGKRGK